MTRTQIISHLWQSTAVGIGILGLLALSKGLSARTRRVIAWVGLLKFLVPVAAVAAFLNLLSPAAAKWVPQGPLALAVRLPSETLSRVAGRDGRLVWIIVLALWLVPASLIFAAWLFKGGRIRRGMLAKAVHLRMDREALQNVAVLVGLRTPPACFQTDDDQGPGTLGILAPAVVIPRALVGLLTPAELKALMAHEFIHVRRRDNVWSAVQELLLALFWFDPVVWLLCRQAAVETEKSCDEEVLSVTRDPDAYASGIFKALRLSLGLPQPAFNEAAAMPVVARVNGILAGSAKAPRRAAGAFAAAAALILAAFGGYSGSLVFAGIVPAVRTHPMAAAPTDNGNAITVTLVTPPGDAGLADSEAEVSELTSLDKLPELVKVTEAVAPDGLKEFFGTVTVDMIVDTMGRVRSPHAVATTDPRLNASAEEAVRLWVFTPGIRHGMKVNVHLQLPVEFSPRSGAEKPMYFGGVKL